MPKSHELAYLSKASHDLHYQSSETLDSHTVHHLIFACSLFCDFVNS